MMGIQTDPYFRVCPHATGKERRLMKEEEGCETEMDGA
jgi:hypothetical protein